ncbi:hypothetical protein K435DRAFT_359547 [Dendrothele bispora CBS 962.96]|uniref:Uncharacterized protein n=1 Tax=Dendrothele bispora (strain CBS 962.96) TaxID=1314807 RepID=A0A4S8LDJ0_DENBC|nr:hypothetical protein K435DRAFT_359547 [Dendrothele bispora CBS 962.96]
MAAFFPQASQLLPAFSQALTIARDQVTHNDQVHTGDSDSIVSPGVLGTQSIFDEYETIRRADLRLLERISQEVIDENNDYHYRAQKSLKFTRSAYRAQVIGRNLPLTVTVVYGGKDAQAAWERDFLLCSTNHHPNRTHLLGLTRSSDLPGLVFHNDHLSPEMFLETIVDMLHQNYDDSRRDTEQHSRRRNSNDHDTWPGEEDTDNIGDIADSLPSSSASTESLSSSRSVGTVNGGYTEQDNRRIHRNIETGTYHEGDHINTHEGDHYTVNNGDWKTVVATGGMVTTAFSAGHTIGAHGSYHQYSQLQLPTNHAITIIYPQYSFDQVPSLVVNYVLLPIVLMKLFSLVQQSVLTAFAG